VRVLASRPQGVFDEAATTSVQKTEYLAGARRTQCKARITFAFG
jgi:outer membrane biosynthesis protein TonB